MNRRSFRIGPGAASLMLIAVVLSMTVLGMLAVLNARSDQRLSSRSVEVAESGAQMNDSAERAFAELDGIIAGLGDLPEAEFAAALEAALPEGMNMDGHTVYWQVESGDSRLLLCAADWNAEGFPRLSWTEYRILTEGDEAEVWN